MKLLFLIIMLNFVGEIVIYDKANPKKWYITNDSVMGGVSSSTSIITKEGALVFSGKVSLENNGGFAMTRLPLNVNLDNTHKKIVLKFKGDGKKYQLRLKSSQSQRYWYVKTFNTVSGYQEVVLNLSEFYPSFRGYKLNRENFSATTIKEIAVLIGNKKEEKFRIEIENITIE